MRKKKSPCSPKLNYRIKRGLKSNKKYGNTPHCLFKWRSWKETRQEARSIQDRNFFDYEKSCTCSLLFFFRDNAQHNLDLGGEWEQRPFAALPRLLSPPSLLRSCFVSPSLCVCFVSLLFLSFPFFSVLSLSFFFFLENCCGLHPQHTQKKMPQSRARGANHGSSQSPLCFREAFPDSRSMRAVFSLFLSSFLITFFILPFRMRTSRRSQNAKKWVVLCIHTRLLWSTCLLMSVSVFPRMLVVVAMVGLVI